MEKINFQSLTVFLVGLQSSKHRFKSHPYKYILRGRKKVSFIAKKKKFFDFNIIHSQRTKHVERCALFCVLASHLFFKCSNLIVHLLDVFVNF